MPAVFKYKVYDINTDNKRVINAYATEQYIKRIEGAELLRETRMDVADAELDGDGKLKVHK